MLTGRDARQPHNLMLPSAPVGCSASLGRALSRRRGGPATDPPLPEGGGQQGERDAVARHLRGERAEEHLEGMDARHGGQYPAGGEQPNDDPVSPRHCSLGLQLTLPLAA